MISKLIAVKPGPAAALPYPDPASCSSWVPPYDVADSPNPVHKKNPIVSIISSRTLFAGLGTPKHHSKIAAIGCAILS
jgi:hypothetical protein